MSEISFKELEQQGWAAKAGDYDAWLAPSTCETIEPILSSLGEDFRDMRFLDVCTGTGHLAGAAAARGAVAEGLDFAEPMIECARANYPGVTFRSGDAEALPYGDKSFDFVACNFGLLHFASPETGVAEAHRVLKPGGRYSFTVWDTGFELFPIVARAVEAHGSMDVGLPPAPPFFRFADPGECRNILDRAGFVDVRFEKIPVTWTGGTPEDVLAFVYKSTVRAAMLVEAQSEEARSRIHAAIVEDAGTRRTDDGIALNFPVVMATAAKP